MSAPTRPPRSLLRGEPADDVRQLEELAGVEVLGELGEGSQTVVYRVRRAGVEYAMKVMRRSGGAGEPLVAFRREAALLACVDHPGLARVREVGVVQNRPYLVMDLIRGGRLSEALADGPLAAERVIAIGVEVAGALTAAHGAGLVHRDVKPDNILLPPDGRARLIDFGLATRAADEHVDTVAGTLIYTAPEQSGLLKRPVDGRADLYALGAVLHECATGQPPFSSPDVGELMRMHATMPPPDVHTHRSDLPPALGAIIAMLLAKDPDDRYQSGAGLLADLARLAVESDFPLGTADEPVGSRKDISLVGRDPEFAVLTARWERARGGQGGVAVVEGPPGIGKSRLVRELLAVARRSGHLVLQARCMPDESVPLAPLRAAVDEYVLSIHRLAGLEGAAAGRRLIEVAGSAAPLLKKLSPALDALLDGPELEDDDRHEQFAAAVAAFLIELGRRAGGAVLHIDDVQWLDEASRRVLTRLATELDGTPVLLVLGTRDGEGGPAVPDALIDTTVTLKPFAAPAVAGLLGVMTGGMTISDESAAQLTARTDGNPFALLEYVAAIVDAGLVRPDWGIWQLDLDGLDALDLPGGTADLVLRRLAALDDHSRRVLGVAAAIGARFATDLVADVCGLEPQRTQDITTEAAWQRLVERRDADRYAFVHNRIREALLTQFDPDTLCGVHERIADVLDRRGATDPEAVYALAQHCRLAGVDRDPERIFRTGYAAGRLALADQAPAQALAFLEPAAAAAAIAGRADDFAFYLLLGVACHRDGRFRDAVETLRRALAATEIPFERATALHLIARVHDSTWDTAEQVAAIEQGLVELKRPLPKNPVLVALSTAWQMILGFLVAFTRLGYGTVRGPKRDLFCLLASLNDAAAVAYARELRPATAGVFVLRQGYLVNRLGPGLELVRARVGLAYLARRMGLSRVADRGFANGTRMAAKLEDSRLLAYIAWLHGAALHGSGADDGAALRRVLTEHDRWLDPGHAIDAISLSCWDALLRGDTADADTWFERRRVRVAASGQLSRNALYSAEAGHLARRGRAGEAAVLLKRIRDRTAVQPAWEHVDSITATLIAAIEQSDVGESFDQTVAEFDRMGLGPLSLLPSQECVFVYVAYGRLEQCRLAGDDERAMRLEAASRAVRAVRPAAWRPLLRAHYRVMRAALLQVAQKNEAALARLARDEAAQYGVDSPLVAFEAARIRARALRALGVRGESDRQARYAVAIAAEQEWTHRVRRAVAEFGVRNATVGHSHNQTYTRASDVVSGGVQRQRLDALQQVSLAASRVLDPVVLARIALDETIRILAADRAFLFLLEGDPATLVPHVGRDAAGNDLHEPTAYSSTLVEMVRHSQEALVVTGTEEGAALGSESVVLHGLRSIMVAPLQLDGRLLGVVYLDSRLAKGIFTVDDVGILTAITNHVAVALETARAAQLEVAVITARRERDLAETLRGAMTEISGTLEPAEVLQRLAATVSRVLNSDHAMLVMRAPGVSDDEAVVHIPEGDEDLLRLVDSVAPVVGAGAEDRPAILVQAFDAAASWMAVPLHTAEGRLGALFVVSRQTAAYDQAQAGIAAALVGQGMIAYEKAKLFAEVQRLATTDGLTGVTNRRHFFELATRELAVAERRHHPLVAMMIDIDHFKQVNDTHGHQVGDDVIREVAGRLRSLGRGSDLLGRYGGEEFAVLLSVGEENAATVAERLRGAVGDTPIDTRIGPLAVTISVGATTVVAGDYEVDTVLARADECLYEAKQAGRNRVFIRDSPPNAA